MRKKFSRSIPYIKIIIKSKPRVNKADLLKKFPDFVTNDIVEILNNVMKGKIRIPPRQRDKLRKHRGKLVSLVEANSLRKRRNIIYKQRGGFIATVLPLVATLISTTLANVL